MTGPKELPALLLTVLTLTGCARLGYYAHVGKGGLALFAGGQRVEKVLRDPGTAGPLESRLRFARAVLEFASADLGLPVGKKYRRYVDLERPYVVWTVVATPEFSLEPKTWCFPIAGCVGYRGYFTPKRADRFADRLSARGFDVTVGGVRAFSSLGRLGDPLLNTFIFDDDRRLAGLLFHELAHDLVYVKGDTAFNESFATAVERAAVRRWLEATSASGDAQAAVAGYQLALDRLDGAYAVIERARDRLEALYRSPKPADASKLDAGPERVLTPPEVRRLKAVRFAELRLDLASIDPDGSTSFADWTGRDLNNADLASVGFYRERLGSFEDLLRAVDGDLRRFYASVSCLGELASSDRDRRLEARDWSVCILAGSSRPK